MKEITQELLRVAKDIKAASLSRDSQDLANKISDVNNKIKFMITDIDINLKDLIKVGDVTINDKSTFNRFITKKLDILVKLSEQL